MSNLELLSAGFSAILGTDVVPKKSGGQYSIHDLFSQTYIMKPVEDTHTINRACACMPTYEPMPGSVPCSFNTDDLHPAFDYDFSGVQDDGERYMRGGFEYKRPYGWKRIAIKVVGRYENDAWLGPNGIRTGEAPGEWPVSYHGTNMSNAQLILKEGYKPGPRALFGKGIYSSPSLEMVEKLYAQEFTLKGKTYKIVLQNRVNPDQKNGHLVIIPASQTTVGADYWLSRGGTMTDVRPYGILIRKVSKS